MSDKQQYFLLAATSFLALLSSVFAFWPEREAALDQSLSHRSAVSEALGMVATRMEESLRSNPPTSTIWKEPESFAEDGEWRYDVFTPPRIFIHPETGEFEPRAYQFARKESMPTLELVSASRTLFRFQLSGYVDHPSGRPELALVLIEDTHLRNHLRLRLSEGGRLEDGYTLESFTVERRETGGGAIQRIAYAGIRGPEGEWTQLQGGVPATSSGLVVRVLWHGEELIFTEDQPSQTVSDHTITWDFLKREDDTLHFSISNADASETIAAVFSINPDML
jgi:hypothetical protein